MPQIADDPEPPDLQPVETPGFGQRCLYYAVLLSMGKPATEATTTTLKQKTHDMIRTALEAHDRSRSTLKRADLKRALQVTDPSQSLQATDEVLPALAAVLGVKGIRVHEDGGAIYEVSPFRGYGDADQPTIDIGYTPGHFYALAEAGAVLAPEAGLASSSVAWTDHTCHPKSST